MSKEILYLGDTLLDQAASYLAGILQHFDISFDYVPSHQVFQDDWLEQGYKAIILSDYPAANFTAEQLDALAEKVKAGLGLLMIGGWESYFGLGGNWHQTVLADVLPVQMLNIDDRRNNWNPCVVSKASEHCIVEYLPFEIDLPMVGGFNEFSAKTGSKTVLRVECYQADRQDNEIVFAHRRTYPLLVVGSFGVGNVTAFASDVAPHWVGGLVDWGPQRVVSCAPGANEIEVGNYYAQLFANMVNWTAKNI